MEVKPTSTAVGAEIRGVDLRDLDAATFANIRQALADYGVIFFRDQAITPEEHIAFAERWGPINVNRFFTPVDGYPQIAQVLKEPEQTQNIGGGWHTDHSYDQVPAMASILHALEVPATGGDTLFAGMAAAYDALSDEFKKTLGGLQAEHSSRHIFGAEALAKRQVGDRLGNAQAATQDAVHPVVIRHPESGRKTLYVNPGFTLKIVGWSQQESDALLNFLYQHASQPVFQTRFAWEVNSVAMWDNRATWHYALNDYPGARRYMQRITVEGSPIAA